jgi:hypothetical protein
LRQSLLKDAIEYCNPCLASPLESHEKRSTPCINSSLGIREKSSSRDGDIEYDVFINYHKNEYLTYILVDNLYEVLKPCKVRAFVNSGEEEEEVLDGRTKHAISNATLCLEIFTKEYAHSPRCLSEAKAFQRIKCSYAKAFHRHGMQQKIHIEMLNNWKEALHVVSLVTG